MCPARDIDAVLLLYHAPPVSNAPTILEHVDGIRSNSRFPVFALNTDHRLSSLLEEARFRTIVLHYSLFATRGYHLPPAVLHHLQAANQSYKIAFFQDEHHHCRQRFEFIDRYDINAIYTLLEPEYHAPVYGANTSAETIRTTLPGYVSDTLIARAARMHIPDERRRIDVGYRARRLPYYMGRGAQEKHEIGQRFLERTANTGLRLDIDWRESARLYGRRWYRFLAECRAMLGVEAGVSVFDVDDSARERTEELLSEHPELDFDCVAALVLDAYEGRISYRTVSPRHFEAAAFRVLQVLYEGRYSGVLEPGVHYLPLAKDLSNLDDVIRQLRDPRVRREITGRAYTDLIASGRFSYEMFMREFDEHLAAAAVGDSMPAQDRRAFEQRLRRHHAVRRPITRVRSLRYRPFPGREQLARAYRTARAAVR